MAHEAFEDATSDPYWATIYEQDAELAVDTRTREQLCDLAFEIRSSAGAYLEAARNRMRVAALAGNSARYERQRAYATQGIEVAKRHNLRREQVAFSISGSRIDWRTLPATWLRQLISLLPPTTET